MSLLAIDPGSEQSAWVMWDDVKQAILGHGIVGNDELVGRLRALSLPPALLAVEFAQGYGMTAGREMFETCFWAGRFVEAWHPRTSVKVYRKEVKVALCGVTTAKDKDVREALLDLVGKPGTKKAPGPTYGIRADEWAALAVAVVAAKSNGLGHGHYVTVEPEHD